MSELVSFLAICVLLAICVATPLLGWLEYGEIKKTLILNQLSSKRYTAYFFIFPILMTFNILICLALFQMTKGEVIGVSSSPDNWFHTKHFKHENIAVVLSLLAFYLFNYLQYKLWWIKYLKIDTKWYSLGIQSIFAIFMLAICALLNW